MSYDAHVSAVRAAGDRQDDGSATRLRLRRSLESRGRRRRQLASLVAAIAIMFGGTLSWALATGQLERWWMHLVHAPAHHAPIDGWETPTKPAPIEAPVPREAPAPQRAVTPDGPPLTTWAPVAEPAPPVPGPRPAPPHVVSAPVERLYRKAHELHFHGNDVGAALAAWDGYLAAEPAGRFSVEARYNRALCLVRLARYAEARTALDAFAHGTVEPAGYRQVEARALIDRIDRIGPLNDPAPTGDHAR